MTYTIGFLGTGNIAADMARALNGSGHKILVSQRNAKTAAALAAAMPEVTIAPNETVVANADILFLCLLARTAAQVLPGLPFRADQTVISVMVDMPLARLRSLCVPATDIVLTIPLPPIAQGGCPLPVFPDCPALHRLFGDRNLILPQPSETALNAHLAASAICATLLDQMMTTADWLAAFTGDDDAAQAYVAAMIRGYLSDRPRPGALPAALRGLSTEGGLNATLRAAMAPAKDSLRNGLDGFRPRLGLPLGPEP
jgi:pyrroline-5-carboxylate reductase